MLAIKIKLITDSNLRLRSERSQILQPGNIVPCIGGVLHSVNSTAQS
jgi:hypothetical protein